MQVSVLSETVFDTGSPSWLIINFTVLKVVHGFRIFRGSGKHETAGSGYIRLEWEQAGCCGYKLTEQAGWN